MGALGVINRPVKLRKQEKLEWKIHSPAGREVALVLDKRDLSIRGVLSSENETNNWSSWWISLKLLQ